MSMHSHKWSRWVFCYSCDEQSLKFWWRKKQLSWKTNDKFWLDDISPVLTCQTLLLQTPRARHPLKCLQLMTKSFILVSRSTKHHFKRTSWTTEQCVVGFVDDWSKCLNTLSKIRQRVKLVSSEKTFQSGFVEDVCGINNMSFVNQSAKSCVSPSCCLWTTNGWSKKKSVRNWTPGARSIGILS